MNLLNELVLWTVHRNADQFRRALSADDTDSAEEAGGAETATAAAAAAAAAPETDAPWVREALGRGGVMLRDWNGRSGSRAGAKAGAGAGRQKGAGAAASAAASDRRAEESDDAALTRSKGEAEQLVLPRGADSSTLFEGLESGMGGPWSRGGDGLTSAWRELDALSVSSQNGTSGDGASEDGTLAGGGAGTGSGSGDGDGYKRVHSRLREEELWGGRGEGDGDKDDGGAVSSRQSVLEEALAQSADDNAVTSPAARRRMGGESSASTAGRGWGPFGLGTQRDDTDSKVRTGKNVRSSGGDEQEVLIPLEDGGVGGPVGGVRALVNRLWKAVRQTANR